MAAVSRLVPATKPVATPRSAIGSHPAQALFNFDAVSEEVSADVVEIADDLPAEPEPLISVQAEAVAHDYQLQMQAYALALRQLVRTASGSGQVKSSMDSRLEEGLKINSLKATLHFIDPNIEVSLPETMLDQESCARAIDDAMLSISTLDGTLEADLFPPLPATHCRICNFLELCPAGRDWLKQ
jgi:CRISPR/Cas system-associated exonuclease Cas4 (RecB family)